MRRALFQTIASAAVLLVCLLGVAWIQSMRPEDPPLLRADDLETPVRAHRLVRRPATTLRRTLPGVLEPWLISQVRAEVAGRVHFPAGLPELGSRVEGRPSRPGNGGQERSELDSGEGCEPILIVEPETYRLERELAEKRHEQALARRAAGEAELEQARELLALAETNLQLARNAMERLQGRFSSGASGSVAVSDQDVEDAVREVGRASGNLSERRAGVTIAEQQSTTDIAAIAVAERELELAQRRETKASVRSSYTGYLERRYISEGTNVRVGEALMDIVVVDPLRVVTYLSDELLARLGPKTRARVVLADLRSEELVERRALLAFVAPRADPATRSVRVEFRLPNPPGQLASPGLDGRLPADLACIVHVELGLQEEGLWIPESALRWIGGEAEVVRAIEDSEGVLRARPTKVRLGFFQDGAFALATSAPGELGTQPSLREGDVLAVGDLDALEDGEPLRVLVEDAVVPEEPR